MVELDVQGSVATSHGAENDNDFIANLFAESKGEIIFKIGQHVAKFRLTICT